MTSVNKRVCSENHIVIPHLTSTEFRARQNKVIELLTGFDFNWFMAPARKTRAAMLEETEHFCRMGQQEVAKIVQCGDIRREE